MTSKTTLSDTQSLLLSQASQHPMGLAQAPAHLPAAARNAVVRSLLKQRLLEEVPAPTQHRALAWRQEEDGAPVALRITEAGLRAIGCEPEEAGTNAGGGAAPTLADEAHTAPQGGPEGLAGGEGPQPAAAAQDAPVAVAAATSRLSLREAAQAVVVAWEGAEAAQDPDAITGPLEALRAALARQPTAARQTRDPAAPRRPREGTKQQAVLALLRRPEGASIADVIAATGWAPHTVRGFLAGLKKKGITVAVLERVRQVGPGKEGAKGSYSIYHVAAATPAEAD